MAILLGLRLPGSRSDADCPPGIWARTNAELIAEDENGVTDLYVVKVRPHLSRADLSEVFQTIWGFYRPRSERDLFIALFDEETSAAHFGRIMRGFVAAEWPLAVDMDDHWVAMYSSRYFTAPGTFTEVAWVSPTGKGAAKAVALSPASSPACRPPWET
jgi:hypothetical protein